jgi:hypothetical protein
MTDWEIEPTVEGNVVYVEIGEDGQPDVLHIKPTHIAEDTANLNQTMTDEGEEADPMRPFILVGGLGTLARHDYYTPEVLMGKHCVIYADSRFVRLGIEPKYSLVTWCEYN